MLSLLDHLNRRSEPTGGLLGGYTPSRDLVDRATLLPIGQYEDGSLTFAWPGFLKDAYEGAVRSAVAQEGAPLYDDGGQYVSGAQMQPLDAFNAASIAPVAGVGMRAAGMATAPTRDAFMAENLVRQFPEEKVISGGDPIGNNWFGVGGESFWDSSRGLSKLHELPRASRTNGMSWDPVKPPQNDLAGPMTDYDLSALSQAWRNKVRNTGEFFANPDNASLPSLLGQSQQGTQLASADPQYDAYDLLQQMRRPPPSPFWIDFQALDQQQMMDPPQMTIPPERQSPERLIPLRDKW